ncbi:MAG: carboxypeptidase-like regulatory domain-containing protein [Bacteroidetes bacterium]|nr:carboxypeptidase-like regulatory domain-containing protein [Bacteroidota bacterium]
MIYRIITLLTIISMSTPSSFSQRIEASGRVLDKESGEGVPYVTIYVNGTTIGTTSDLDGYFRIEKNNIPCELVLSHVSYELQRHKISDTTQLSGLHFELSRRILVIGEVTVVGQGAREEYLSLFKIWFLGPDHKKRGSVILNDSAIHFISLEGDQFEAYASQPLVIELPETGYRLKMDLVHFKLFEDEALKAYHCSIRGYFFFEEMAAKSRRHQRSVARKRIKTYYNSRLHFCRSLYENKLLENGYRFERICYDPVEDSLSRFIHRDYTRGYPGSGSDNTHLILTDFPCPAFRVIYYFRGSNKPVDLTNLKAQPSDAAFSVLRFLNDTIRIEATGWIPENSILFGGAIGDKRVAWMLPEDYIPSMQ